MKRLFSKTNTRAGFFLVAMLSTLVLVWASKEMLKDLSSSSKLPQEENKAMPSQNLEESAQSHENSPEIFYDSIGRIVEKTDMPSVDSFEASKSLNFQIELAGLFEKEKLDKIYETIKSLHPQTTMVPIQIGNKVQYKIIVELKTNEDEALKVAANIRDKTQLQVDVKRL